MRLPTVLRYLLAVLTVGCASGTALAQTPSRVRDGEYWEVITTAQGCHAILSDELEMHWGPDPNVRFSWNGGCDANGLITGSGTLITEFRASWGARVRTEMSGVATQGLFAGRVERATYSDDDDFDPKTPPGAMVLVDKGVANPMAFLYQRGCSYFIDSNGATEPEPDFSGCNGNDGIAFWKKTLAAVVPNGSVAVNPPAPQPQAAAGDEAFQSNLKTFEADQLFAMANDLVQRGEFDMAKLARNALLARFPDSPLVTTIVQLLASTAQPAAPAAAPAMRQTDQGNAEAQYNLGVKYAEGEGVPQNDIEAVRWFRLAADQGYAPAQAELGFMYMNGLGLQESDVEAVRWYRLATEQGNATAQTLLANMYAIGQGVQQNDVEAYKLYSLAAAQGNNDASSLRDLIRGGMTPAQIAEASSPPAPADLP